MCVVEHKLVKSNVIKQQSDVQHTFLFKKKLFVHLYQTYCGRDTLCSDRDENVDVRDSAHNAEYF